jgi:hypothetical protein
MMVMASYEDGERDENQRANQAPSPPTILFQDLLLKAVETSFDALCGYVPSLSGATRFFRHQCYLALIFVQLLLNGPASAVQWTHGPFFELATLINRRSPAAEVTMSQVECGVVAISLSAVSLSVDQRFHRSDGRRFRVLCVLDDFSRECLTAVVDTSLGGMRVVRELELVVS